MRQLQKQRQEDAVRQREEEEERQRQRRSMFLIMNDSSDLTSPVSPPRKAFSPTGTFIGNGWLPANPITEHDEDDVPPLPTAEDTPDGHIVDVRRPSEVLTALKDNANRDTAIRSREASGTYDNSDKSANAGSTPNVNFDLPPASKGTQNGGTPIPIPWPSSRQRNGNLPGSGTSTAMHSEVDIPLQILNAPAPNSRAERDPTISRKTILKRDRMLIKEDWTPAEDLPMDFDEMTSRKYSIHSDKWRELVVILRMRRLELWQESVSIRHCAHE